MRQNFQSVKKFIHGLGEANLHNHWGKITKVQGGLIESKGFSPNLYDLCQIEENGNLVKGEVIGFDEEKVQLMLYEQNATLNHSSLVRTIGSQLKVPVGEELLGRILNGLGEPIDGKPLFSRERMPVLSRNNNNALNKEIIDTPISLGVKSIDALLSVGQGQRMGVFAGSGVGKSTLLSMVAKNNTADVNVIVLVGERGREIKEFIENYLGAEGLAKTVMVVSTSDDAPLSRVKSVFTGTTIAEYFKDQGKNVFLLVDSLTRLAHAQRVIGTYLKEPPTSKGFPPSLFELLPNLLERSGNFKHGSITSFYSVLVEGDDFEEPITDAVRGILDGHISLSKKIAQRGQFPAIDIPASLSRLMPNIVSPEHLEIAYKIKEWISLYQESEDMINIGAYVSGTNPKLDLAISKINRINEFLKQSTHEKINASDSFAAMQDIFNN